SDAFAEEKRVGLIIRRNLPTVGEVRDNGPPTVHRVAADEIIVHTALGAHIGYGSRLVHIKVCWRAQDAIPQHPAMLGIKFRGAQLEVRRSPCPGHCRWDTKHEATGSCDGASGGPEKAAPRQPMRSGMFLLSVMPASLHIHSFLD